MRCVNMQRNDSKHKIGASAYLIYAVPVTGKHKTDTRYAVHPDILMINRVSQDDQGYHYSLVDSNEDIIDWCYEENVFGTLEDAKEEVEKRNKTLREA